MLQEIAAMTASAGDVADVYSSIAALVAVPIAVIWSPEPFAVSSLALPPAVTSHVPTMSDQVSDPTVLPSSAPAPVSNVSCKTNVPTGGVVGVTNADYPTLQADGDCQKKSPPERRGFCLRKWSGGRDSNSRHSAWKADALPAELPPQK